MIAFCCIGRSQTCTLTVLSHDPNSGVAVTASPGDNNGVAGGNTAFTLTYGQGATVQVTAPPAVGGNNFQYWTLDGTPQAAGQSTLPVTMSTNHTVVAVYVASTVYTLTVLSQGPNSGINVSISPNDLNGQGSGSTTLTRAYGSGASVTLSAPPISGTNSFLNWTLDGVPQTPGQTALSLTMSGNHTTVAVYGSTPQYALTVLSLNPNSKVTFGAAPADNNGNTGGSTPALLVYKAGSSVTLSAQIASGTNGTLFSNWLLDGIAQPTGQTSLVIKMDGNHAATAVYVEPVHYNLTVQTQDPPSGVQISVTPNDLNGSGSGNPVFQRQYSSGTNVVLAAPPTQSYDGSQNTFQYWLLDGNQQPAGKYTLNLAMNDNHTVVAVYLAPTVYTLTVLSQDSGLSPIVVSPNDNGGNGNGQTPFLRLYNPGTSVSLNAPPTDAGRSFQYWLLDGVQQQTGLTSLSLMMGDNHTVVAVYNSTPGLRTLTVLSQDPNLSVVVASNSFGNIYTPQTVAYTVGATDFITAPSTAGGNNFAYWVLDGQKQTAGQLWIQFTMSTNHTIAAVYQAPVVFALTVLSIDPGVVGWFTSQSKGTIYNSPLFVTYAAGATDTITAPSTASGNNFAYWLLDGQQQTAGQLWVQVTMNASHTITAVYQPPVVYALTVLAQNPFVAGWFNSQSFGTLYNSPILETYNAGVTDTITAPTTANGNNFAYWLLDGQPQTAGQAWIQLTMNANHTIQAVYQTPAVYTLTVTSQDPNAGVSINYTANGSNGSSSSTFTLAEGSGTTVTLTAPAASGKNAFQYWLLNGIKQGVGQLNLQTTLSANATATAVYQAPSVYSLTVLSQNPASGVAVTTSQNDMNGSGSGSTTFIRTYSSGSTVTLSPAQQSSTGTTFDHWVLDGANQTVVNLAVTMNANHTVIAVYKMVTYTVSVSSQNPNSGVAVSASPADNAGSSGGPTGFTLTYNKGTAVTLTAPSSQGGAPFAYWSLDGNAQTQGLVTLQITMNAVHSVTAVYAFSLTVSSQGPASGVSISAAPADNSGNSGGTTTFTLFYNPGVSVTLTPAATEGANFFAYWILDGTQLPTGQPLPAIAMNGSHSATVVYLPHNPHTIAIQSSNPNSGVSITVTPSDNSKHGTGSTSLTRTYNWGTVVSLTAPATAGGHNFAYWTVDNQQQLAGQRTLQVTTSADHTAVAVYLTPYILTLQSTNPASGVPITVAPADVKGQGNGKTSFTRAFNSGTVVALTAPPTTGSKNFGYWRVDAVAQPSGQLSIQVSMNAKHTVVAVYLTAYTLTVQSQNPSTGVSVSVSPNDTNNNGNGTTAFARTYNSGTVVNLTAPQSSATGGSFQYWTVNGRKQPKGQASIQVTMSANETTIAVYSQ